MYDAFNNQDEPRTAQPAFAVTAKPMVTDEQLDSRAAPNAYFNAFGPTSALGDFPRVG